ncbi:alpha/beta fold hydrolase [Lewinella sp. W8]|nr:alpha/beta fold hydrolase [Lewinella sp. W8]
MDSWQYPFPVHYHDVNDSLRLAYVDEGKGERTLVFVHGLGSNLQAWKKNVAALRKDYRCIALDLPGYGKSGKGEFPYSMDFFAESLDALIRGLELEKVTLVGHSMGGQIAMTLALQRPDYLEKMVLAAPAGLESFSETDRTFFATYVRPEILMATPEAQIKKNFAVNFFDMPEDAQFMIQDRLALREDSAAYAAYCAMIPRCVMGMLDAPVANRLGAIEVPTLILFGENDQLIPNKILHPTLTVATVAEVGEKGIPGAQLSFLPESGHFVQWEKSDRFNTYLRQFIQ